MYCERLAPDVQHVPKGLTPRSYKLILDTQQLTGSNKQVRGCLNNYTLLRLRKSVQKGVLWHAGCRKLPASTAASETDVADTPQVLSNGLAMIGLKKPWAKPSRAGFSSQGFGRCPGRRPASGRPCPPQAQARPRSICAEDRFASSDCRAYVQRSWTPGSRFHERLSSRTDPAREAGGNDFMNTARRNTCHLPKTFLVPLAEGTASDGQCLMPIHLAARGPPTCARRVPWVR